MPLIVLCGLPCSGKTTRARQLLEYLQQSCPAAMSDGSRKLHLINDESLHLLEKTAAYADSNAEKITRASHYSAVERLLNNKDIVIADAMNYIKGYRYQLYCLARAQATTYCVVYCDTARETVREWNHAPCNDRYSAQLLDDLIMRFEEPSAFARWDSPLIVVQTEDEASTFCERVQQVVLPSKAASAKSASGHIAPVMSTLPVCFQFLLLEYCQNNIVETIDGFQSYKST
jgi:protein KTI12